MTFEINIIPTFVFQLRFERGPSRVWAALVRGACPRVPCTLLHEEAYPVLRVLFRRNKGGEPNELSPDSGCQERGSGYLSLQGRFPGSTYAKLESKLNCDR
jgi:hypothetical protein